MNKLNKLVVLCLLALIGHGASAQGAGTLFDHVTTGYELTGAHKLQACESCHVDAVFQGTPRECLACHSRGSRVGATPKTSDHILSTERCDACHTTSAWTPATRFDHEETRGSCASCHNNAQAPGKPAGHIATTMECNACHGTVAWSPSKFDHGSRHRELRLVPQPGQHGDGKGPSHLQTSNACEACHTVGGMVADRPASITPR